ncbi:hypothetical protein Srut_56500 [Streptomyces rutgersensis]|nr:hypothetical protein Srut_56500 [Streptomyces rutgersensis]
MGALPRPDAVASFDRGLAPLAVRVGDDRGWGATVRQALDAAKIPTPTRSKS